MSQAILFEADETRVLEDFAGRVSGSGDTGSLD